MSFDRQTVIRFWLGVTFAEGILSWSTNDFNSTRTAVRQWMTWSPVPGQNIEQLAKIFEPVITNLGAHLQWQDDSNVYRLIPALEWLESLGLLSQFGQGLLSGVKKTQDQGSSPRPQEN